MKLFRRTVAWAAHYAGLTALSHRALVNRAPCVALLYHRVYSRRRELGSIPMGETHASRLAAHLKWIVRNCRVRDVAGWLEDLADPSLRGPPRVLVTFDDAYRDFFRYAAPICGRLGIRPLVFVPTGFVDDREARPWWDLLYRATPPAGADLDSLLKRLIDAAGREPLNATAAVRAEALRQEWVLPSPPDRNEFACWEELRTWRSAADFGSHGRFHVSGAALSEAELREDFSLSKRRIESELEVPVRTLAYPYGSPAAASAPAQRVARECGFEAAFCAEGSFDARGSSRWALPRCVFPTGPVWSFSAHWLAAAAKSRFGRSSERIS